MPHRRSPRRLPLFLLALTSSAFASMALCGCQSGTSGHRPVVDETAAEAVAKSGTTSTEARALNFFDELEGRPLVAHDDVLEGALMLGTGRGGANFEDRVQMAKSLGYIDVGYNTIAHEAATIGEVSQILIRAARGIKSVSMEEAMGEMVARGAIPPGARSFQGLTGAQLVSMLGAASDVMKGAGVGRSSWPAASEPVRPVERAEAPKVEGKGHPEPLPEVPLAEEKKSPEPPAPGQPQQKPPSSGDEQGPIAQSTPTVDTASTTPASAPIYASAVVPAAPVKPKTTTNWVPAKPLKGSEPIKGVSGGQ